MSEELPDHLKKYAMRGDDDNGGGGKRKRRRKKTSSSSSALKHAAKSSAPRGEGLRIIDDEEDTAIPDRKRVEKAWEDEEQEEEKPAVVVDAPESSTRAQLGSWTTLGGGDVENEDISPPRRRRRHDSSDEDASPPRRPRSNGTGAADLGDDTSPPRRPRSNGSRRDADASPPRRDRNAPIDDRHGQGRGRRDIDKKRGRSVSADASPPRRPRSKGSGRNESDNADAVDGAQAPDASPLRRRRRRRHDSSDDEGSPPGKSERRSQDSSPPRRMTGTGSGDRRSDASPVRDEQHRERGSGSRRRGDASASEKERSGGGDRVKTSSGYYAGLQSGQDFKTVEQQLRRKQDAELKATSKETSGQGAKTVYRDKKGRKLDMLNEFMKQQDARAGKKVEEAKEQFAWGRGKVQKEEAKQWKEELENIAAEPFARAVDDARLEEMRKAEIRADDPMAAYMAKKKAKERVKSGKPLKPEYKGPAPKPNRFGIRPGYRWDGIDRGNGWEDRIVAKGVDNRYKADLAHKWATADM